MSEDPSPAKPTRWPRLAAFFTGSECHGWHAACPTIRSERRRARLAGEAGGKIPSTDGPVETSSYRTG